MPEDNRKRKPGNPSPGGGGGDDPSPQSPKVEKPDVNDLLKRMKKVDPDQAKRYRQRTGQ